MIISKITNKRNDLKEMRRRKLKVHLKRKILSKRTFNVRSERIFTTRFMDCTLLQSYQLDILVTLNGNTFINIEMQVINYNNWPMRSLSYMCRRFDNVSRGNDYNTVYAASS